MSNQAALKLVGKEDGDKQRALEAALAQIDRAFGKGSVMKLGEKGKVEMESVSTGSLGLDLALGIGGLPKGRIVEIYGPESSGKTTLALHVVAEVQKAGGTAAFIDAEHALDPAYAHKLKVNLDDLLVAQPDLFGLMEPHTDWLGLAHNVGWMWLWVGVGGLLFRVAQLWVIQGPMTGIVWAAKILTDPFHDIKLYHRAPLHLLRGEMLDPGHRRG